VLVNCQESAEDSLQAIVQDMQSSIENGEYPSVAFAVAVDDTIRMEGAFGWADIQNKTAANEHTMYSLASVSKPITTTGLMLLVERGLIDLDKPVNDYLGDAKLNVRVGDPNDVTVKRVAQHTAGLPLYYHFFYEDEPYQRPSMDETIRKFGNVVFQPDDLYQYSNLGYGILDYVIERVSGKSYPAFMKDEVFIPLNMNNAAVLTPDTYTGNEAVRYDNEKKPIPFYDFDHRGASAVYASAHDLALFGMFHNSKMQDGQTQIMSEETLHTMHHEENKFGGYAIGWGVESHKGMRVLQHTGGMGGVRTVLTLVPEMGVVVAVLTNCENDGIQKLKNRILRVLSKDHEPVNAEENEPEEEKNIPSLDGTWQGKVVTYNKEMPFEIHVKDHVYTIAFNNEEPVQLKDVYFNGEVLFGNFLGDIQTPEEYNPGYKLELKVVVKDPNMYGAVTSMGDNNGRVRNALSHFVQLKHIDK
jgi:CubicO group peptidase (beta-lactamase class C family)